MDKRDAPSKVPNKKALPRNISKRPMIKTKCAVALRINCGIALSITALGVDCQWGKYILEFVKLEK
jgi:hypothetical protein